MSTDTSHAIAKIKIIKELTNINEVKQLCNVIVELIEAGNEAELGFGGTTAKRKPGDV